jgi:hypothetical protein
MVGLLLGAHMLSWEETMIKSELEFVYEATGSLGAPVPIGDSVDGTRRIGS